MRICPATVADIDGLARLLWLDTLDEDPDPGSVAALATDLTSWWDTHRDTHHAFIAQPHETEHRIVGMAWVALVPRIPRPGATRRFSADIQTVFVEAERRGSGIGSALVNAAAAYAEAAGAAAANTI